MCASVAYRLTRTDLAYMYVSVVGAVDVFPAGARMLCVPDVVGTIFRSYNVGVSFAMYRRY